MTRVDAFYQELPKAELHVHLEGSIEPETLRELEPSLAMEEILRRYQYQDFAGFIQGYIWVTGHLKTPENYAHITRRLLESLARQNVRHAEINLSAGVILWRKLDLAAVHDAVAREAARSSITVRWIWDAVRHFGPEPALEMVRCAVGRADAIGIGGDEQRGPASLFRDVFRFARQNGLRLMAHAGETAGPESIWQALELGVERIGHGIRAVDDPVLMQHLRDHNIPLEVCPSSNVCTGAVRSLAEHPLRRLYEAGVPVTIHSDDPAMFHTTLSGEYELAERAMGFSRQELAALAARAFDYRL